MDTRKAKPDTRWEGQPYHQLRDLKQRKSVFSCDVVAESPEPRCQQAGGLFKGDCPCISWFLRVEIPGVTQLAVQTEPLFSHDILHAPLYLSWFLDKDSSYCPDIIIKLHLTSAKTRV